MEERSEREGTALDAHKELELVSRASSLHISQSTVFSSRPTSLSCSLLSWYCLWKMQIHFHICSGNSEKSPGPKNKSGGACTGRGLPSPPRLPPCGVDQAPSGRPLLTDMFVDPSRQPHTAAPIMALGGPAFILSCFQCQKLRLLPPRPHSEDSSGSS